ncbi:MAG: translation elongation factor Ts [bacterium]|nr:translation elongation factor Ts [bacterium]
MQIDINLVKQLRDMTFAPLGDCKNALVEAGGDLEKAVAILKEKGIAKAGKKADRETNEGLIKTHKDGERTFVVKLLCETDFVAKNETFLALFDKVFAELKATTGEIENLEALAPELTEKINTLIAEAVSTIGENLRLGEVFITSNTVYVYSHAGDKVVSVVAYNGDENVAKELALQVAALNPEFLTLDEVPADEKEKLAAQFTEELKAAGKPEAMIPNIVKGKVDKAFADNVLLEQEYIRDGAKKVKEILPAGFEVSKFYRFAV